MRFSQTLEGRMLIAIPRKYVGKPYISKERKK